jgi:hypothetical protein
MKSIVLLLAAALTLAFAGCGSPGAYSARTDVVIGADDYDYYPGYEVYYSRAHNYYYYRDGNVWVHRPNPPRNWARTAPSVHMHLNDAPDRHHPEVVKQYPRNWRPADRVAPADKRDGRVDRDHDGRDDRHDRDDHDRNK